MILRIILFAATVTAMAAFGLFTQAKAQFAMTTPSGYCEGLIACSMQRHWEEEQQQKLLQAQGPHPCTAWNGHRWVQMTCAP